MHFIGFRQPIDTYVAGWRRVAKNFAKATFKDTVVAASSEATALTNGVLITLKPNQALKILRYLMSATEAAFSGNLLINSMQFVYTGANGDAADLAHAFLAYGGGYAVSNFSSLASPAVIGEQVTPSAVTLSVVDDWFEWDSVPGWKSSAISTFTLMSGLSVVNDGAGAHTVHVGESLQYEIWEKSVFSGGTL